MQETVAYGNHKHRGESRLRDAPVRAPKMQKPPATFIEFLHFKHLKDWPEIPSADEPLHNECISVPRYSLDMINKQFITYAPFSESAFADVESKIDKNMAFLDNYFSQILCPQALENDKDIPRKVFLTEADEPELSLNRKDKIKPFLKDIHKKEDGEAEKCVYPGYDRTDLPGNLKAPWILQNVAKVQKLKERTGKIILMLFLSEKSIAIFQDCFWCFFLQRFKPQQIEQDYLFDRISDTFVALFCSIPHDVKDIFIQMYPDYLSQSIFAAFYKAFPQSRAQFNGGLKAEIVDLIFQWVSGIKPVPCSWEKWDLNVLECQKNYQNCNENVITAQNCNLTGIRRLEFNLDDLLEEARQPNFPKPLHTEAKDAPQKESHSVGPGPEFHHVRFQLGSHSVLVSNYLKKHQFTGCIHGISRHRIKRTEISHVPPVGPTYEDIITETQSVRKSLKQDYDILETKIQKELAEIQQQNVNVKYKIEKMKQELSSGVKLNSTLLLEKLQKMPFSSKLFRKKDLTIQDVLDADESAPITEQTLVIL
ncbi:protein FAM227B [Anomaloglossus baeobatrachus]|uniref:protein FAM227B n=1 Tax=Anomaloglossus baeobatrachus TaxID=238106 RepID=UPI003F50B2EB